MSKYPEHDKLKAVKDKSQAIGEFLSWFLNKGGALYEWREAGDNGEIPYTYEFDRTGKPATEEDYFNQHHPNNWSIKGKVIQHFNEDYDSWEEGHYYSNKRIPEWLAEYFEIDQNKLDAEKEEMLNSFTSK